jgi:CDP-glucose 4,6-dehydratase
VNQILNKLRETFAGKRVLVIGDTGFKGSWLCLILLELGAEIQGYALPAERDHDHFNLLGLDRLFRHTSGDIRELSSISKVFGEFKPEFVFHLAAQALVRRSYYDPKLTFDTNLGGSVNILECIRETSSVKSAIYVTSDKCYQNQEWVWGYRENDELGGRDPYSASKAGAELVLASYCSSFFAQRAGLGIASVRAGNVIGGGDWSQDRIVPDCIRALKEGEPIVLRSPHSTRPWQHVLEPLSGYLVLAAALRDNPKPLTGAWNFGPRGDSTRTVYDLAQGMIKRWGSGKVEIDATSSNLHEARLLHLNCDKACNEIGWRARWDFDRTVEATVAWYRLVNDGRAAIEISRQQILDYFNS